MKNKILVATGLIFAAQFPAQAQQVSDEPDVATENSPAQAENPEAPSADEKFAADGVEPVQEPSKEALAGLAIIDAALKKIDPEIEREGNGWQFLMGDRQVLIVTDPLAERMRIIIPIAPAELLTADVMKRLMQANFDSALDARYAVGQDLLWGTFIHPLNGLAEEEFLSGLLQTINIVESFGTTFSSGAMVFGGGDSQNIMENQLEELIKEREKASKI